MPFTTERVLVLGAGRWQLDLIEQAKRNGLWVLATDIAPDAPGQDLADEFRQVDTSDREALCDIARGARIGLVLTDQTDRTVPVVAHLNEALDLPGIRPPVAERFTNKLAMRDALAATSVAMPSYASVADYSEARAFATRHGFPLVAKPLIGQSSVGVQRVDDEVGLRHVLGAHTEASPPMLIETFVEGTEVTVEALTLRGQTKILGISEKRHYEANPCVAKQLAYPPRLSADVLAMIRSNASHVVEVLGLRDGISHGEYRLRDGTPFLLEVAARGGGNRIASRIVHHVSGINVYDLLIRTLLGDEPTFPDPIGRAAILEWLDVAPGRVHSAPDPDELLRTGVVSEASLSFGAGDRIVGLTDANIRPGYFIVLGDTRDQVDTLAAHAREVLSAVTYAREDGRAR